VGYNDRLGDLPGVSFHPEAPRGTHTRRLTSLTVREREFGVDREALREALDRAGVEARPLWKSMHMQPPYRGCEVHAPAVGAELVRSGLSLPSGSAMTGAEHKRKILCHDAARFLRLGRDRVVGASCSSARGPPRPLPSFRPTPGPGGARSWRTRA
jgi:hypothetical protein